MLLSQAPWPGHNPWFSLMSSLSHMLTPELAHTSLQEAQQGHSCYLGISKGRVWQTQGGLWEQTRNKAHEIHEVESSWQS